MNNEPLSQPNQNRRVLTALSVPQFRECWPALESFMARSRVVRDEPLSLLTLQAAMARELRGAQESQRELQGKLGDEDRQAKKVIQERIEAAKRFGYVIKQIVDGIAWRTLDYKRPIVQALSTQPAGGQLNLESTPQELEAAARYVVQTGNIAVVNDLTSVLRYGDWTGISPDGTLHFGEEKAGKGSRRSGHTKRQRKRLKQIQEFCRRGIGRTPEGRSMVFVHRTKLKTHLQGVEQVLLDARSSGSAHARLSECVAVDAWDMRHILDGGSPFALHNPFAATRETVTTNSLARFDRMSAGPAPYSIFPFSAQDCTDLMTGAMCLISHVDLGRIVQLFRENGLQVNRRTEEEMRVFTGLDIGEKRKRRDEIAERISRPDAPATVLLGGGTMSRLVFEFLHEDSLVEMEEEMLDFAWPPFPIAVFSQSPDEEAIWD